jgi:hypothetical protein
MKRGQQPEEANSLGAPRVFCPHTVSRDTKIPAAPEIGTGLYAYGRKGTSTSFLSCTRSTHGTVG